MVIGDWIAERRPCVQCDFKKPLILCMLVSSKTQSQWGVYLICDICWGHRVENVGTILGHICLSSLKGDKVGLGREKGQQRIPVLALSMLGSVSLFVKLTQRYDEIVEK